MLSSQVKVQILSLEQFTAFEEATFDFCPGINVLIGANATGKSHIMKVIYSLLKVYEKVYKSNYQQRKTVSFKLELDEVIDSKLYGVFQPDSLYDFIRLEEGSLVFDFGNQWQVFKFDGHHDYQKMKDMLEGTKAIDFLGIHEKELYLIEVKDFRQHRIETRDRLLNGELPIEVAQKARDSLACLLGARHTSANLEHWQPYARLLCRIDVRIKVVLWLEHDLPPHPLPRKKVMASVRTNVFKKKLAWLTSLVLVCGSHMQNLPDVKVSNLPRP